MGKLSLSKSGSGLDAEGIVETGHGTSVHDEGGA